MSRDWSAADWQVAFDERAAILEYDNGLSRTKAEAQARAEMRDLRLACGGRDSGILGELLRAARGLHDPDLLAAATERDIAGRRPPIWGFDRIVPEAGTKTYRPALARELAEGAVIVPAFSAEGSPDLVAQSLTNFRMMSRLGIASAIGANEIVLAREDGRPLFVFDDAVRWLRGSTRGAVIIDWEDAAQLIDGIAVIQCNQRLAPTLYRATRCCRPAPAIRVPAPKEMSHVA